MSTETKPRGKRVVCPTCERAFTVRAGEEWEERFTKARLRIVSPEQDGAIVEQVGREWDGRWGVSYSDLQSGYHRVPTQPVSSASRGGVTP